MRKTLCLLFCAITLTAMARTSMTSPDKRLTAAIDGQELAFSYQGRPVLRMAQVGMEGLTLLPGQEIGKSRRVKADYRMLAGKRLHCTNQANEYRLALSGGAWMVLRLYNDGLVYRYELPAAEAARHPAELSAYRIGEGTRRWMQQWNDACEGFFPLTTTSASKGGNHWCFPALTEPADGIFVLLSEANIERRQSAAALVSDGDLYRVCPDKNDAAITDDWHTPWRVAIVGSLADVVQSTLVTDVSEPCQLADTQWIKPGVASWVYWAYNHGSNDYNIIKKYVDLAATLHLPYVLIDAEWDEMKDGKTIADALDYAHRQGVKPIIWYNSSVGWVNGAPGPKYRLNKAEDREREFAWCEQMGVAGVKIDFFSGENQMNMDYCLDLLACAARHHLLVNFHGATVPRGWQRTWPNLLSTEGVYGAEWYNNVPTFTGRAAAHNATLPFTRNVIGPMDYTPCAFSDSQHPHITTHAHELALTVLFESGLQHLADRPESFLAQPQEVQQFLGQLPAAWDETRLVSGYPGESVVMARRSGKTWYIAGINGSDEPRTLDVDARFLKKKCREVTLFTDGEGSSHWSVAKPALPPASVACMPRGGFVMTIQTK